MLITMSDNLFTVFSTKNSELKNMLEIHSKTSHPTDNMKNHFQDKLVERAITYQSRKCTGLYAVKRLISIMNPSGRN